MIAARAWRRLVAFVEQREDATSLALCRIAICATLFAHVVHSLVVGAAGFAWVDVEHGGIGVHPGWILDLAGGATERNVVVACVVCAVAALFGAVGLFTRVSLVVAWLLFRDLSEIAVDGRSAYDVLITNVLFVLILSGCGRALSVDAARAQRGPALPGDRGASAEHGAAPPGDRAARWPRMVLVLQIGLLYFGGAIMKASSGWVPGGDASALWFILHQPLWSRFHDLPSWTYPLTQLATTSVWCFEMLGPFFVLSVFVREAPADAWLRRLLLGRVLERVRFRDLYLVFGLVMHLGIEVTMEVGAFTGASLALYFAALRPAECSNAFISCSRWAYSRIPRRR